MDLVS
jgi:hypothetical protein